MLYAHTIQLNGQDYTIVFNATAKFMFEELSGYTVARLKAWSAVVESSEDQADDESDDEPTFFPSDMEIAFLLTAGLEGCRVRTNDRPRPWTVAEVNRDILGDASGSDTTAVLTVCLRAVAASLSGVDASGASEAVDAEGKAKPTES